MCIAKNSKFGRTCTSRCQTSSEMASPPMPRSAITVSTYLREGVPGRARRGWQQQEAYHVHY